ncbi:MAG: GNAT family N-acetyltransferase [Aggregatilineales bacterium]
MRKELRDGLILRTLSEGFASDRENLEEFYKRVFGEEGDEEPQALGYWTNDLISGAHPTTTLDDVWVVVDPAEDDKIVSALLLIPQTWRYEDVEIPVGRVELVATDKDYRRKGLVKALMDALHERSAELGHLMQVITGIPHYYRRFGYGMAVNLGSSAFVPFDSLPVIKDDQQPDYLVRSATIDDAEQIAEWDASYAEECLLTTVRSADDWRYEIEGRTYGAVFHLHIGIITTPDGDPVGYVAARTSPEYPVTSCLSYIVGEKASYLDTYDDVMRWYKTIREETYSEGGDVKPPTHLGFDSGVPPEIIQIIEYNPFASVRSRFYAWYIRVEDIAGFIQKIAPVLERRLAGSVANRFTGDLKIGFYDFTGVTITFEDGKITGVTQGELAQAEVSFAYLTFLNILFGHRTRQDLIPILPESFAGRKAGILLDVLFPLKRSWLLAFG